MEASSTLSPSRPSKAEKVRALNRANWFLAASATAAFVAIVYVVVSNIESGDAPAPDLALPSLKLEEIPFPGLKAYGYLKEICALGPRISGSEGMKRQRKLLIEHFEKFGAKVTQQEFTLRHPVSGAPQTLSNLIVEWHPDQAERLMLCTHYDTRPFPDNDATHPRGVFLGANDGASGAAIMCALAPEMKKMPVRFGVDFVLFDGEEFVFNEGRDSYFLGSTHFANEYAAGKMGRKYRYGVLLDMVGDADLQIFQEVNSVRWPDTRPLVKEIWDLAAELKVRDFIPRTRHEVRDDHLPLHDIGRIPVIDVIDFDYPRPGSASFWHTTRDIPENCSPLSLAKVGWVVSEWLKRAK